MTLDSAKKCFELGKYEQAHEIAFDLFKNDKSNGEALLLSFKSYLMSFSPEEARKANESERGKFLLQMVETFYSLAKAPEELFDFEEKVIRGFFEWEKRMILSLLKQVETERTSASIQEYIDQFLHYSFFKMFIQVSVYTKSAVAFQLNSDKIEEYHHKVTDSFRERERLECETEMVERSLDQIQQTIDQNSSGCSEYTAQKIIEHLLMMELFSDLTLKYKKEINSESILASLKNSARARDMLLKAKVGYMLNKITLYPGYDDRSKKIEELKKIYDEIKQIDPRFSPPELPEANVPNTKAGCYVATAVYGSYDCPQVWVLRRFRDYYLGEKWCGRLFIKLYYAISPIFVKWFGNKAWFKKIFSKKLDRLVLNLQNKGVESTPYQDRIW